ncbi:MAG: caspase family protein, partial [Maricaulaceae bacterium]
LDNPTKRQLLAGIGQFAERLRDGGEDAVGIFYFAGHGAQGRPPLERDIENYLIPIGATMATETDLESEAVGLSRVSATLSGAGAGAIVIIIDACRDFAMPQANRSSSNTRGLAEARALPGTLVAYSTAPGSIANDGPAGGNGPYAGALARELFAARQARIEDIFYSVRQEVLAETDGEQQPWENSSLVRRISVGPSDDPGDTPGPVADNSTPTTPAVSSTMAVEQVVFAALAAPCEYAMFARDYPDSALRTLASTRSSGATPCDEAPAASGASPTELISRAQTLLAAMDCGDVEVTGVVGTSTRAAAARFREAHGLSGAIIDEFFVDELEGASVGGFVCPIQLPETYEAPVEDLAAASMEKGFEPSYYGEATLSVGFLPDPYTVAISAGGSQDASLLSPGCAGYIGEPPDFNLNYNAGFQQLLISASSDADISLVINTPSGDWVCDDDSAGGRTGLNPGVVFDAPQDGLYNIWVGRYGAPAEFADSELYISEINFYDFASTPRVDVLAEPYFGRVALEAGFAPDPYSVYIEAGGPNEAYTLDPYCTGLIGDAPDFILDYTAGDYPLYISAAATSDTTLVVLTPDDQWACDDDSGAAGDIALNPGVTFEDPVSGEYRIWIGMFDPEQGTSTSTLHISELEYSAVLIAYGRDDVMVDWGAPPIYGSVDLETGFLPDPHTVEVSPGGEVDAGTIDPSCRGWIAAAPDYSVYYTPGIFSLHVFAESEDDTTLLVRTPNDEIVCDDDSALGLNPGISFKSPDAGLYDIWVGLYGGDTGGTATLNISEFAFEGD